MFFLFVAMHPQLVDQGVGRSARAGASARSRALGLRRGGVAQGDFVEAQGGTELL